MNQTIVAKVFCVSSDCPKKPSCYMNFYTLVDLDVVFCQNIPLHSFYRSNSTMGYCTLDKYKED